MVVAGVSKEAERNNRTSSHFQQFWLDAVAPLVMLLHSGFFSRIKIFTNWHFPDFQGGNFHELAFSTSSRGKFSRIILAQVSRGNARDLSRFNYCIACTLYGMAESYEIESVVQGYHIYKEIWSTAVGTTLSC